MKKYILTWLLIGLLKVYAVIISCDGDSLTKGTGSTGNNNGYPVQMNKGSATVVNNGNPGELAASNTGATRTKSTFASSSGGRRVAIFCEGINDLATNDSASNVNGYIDAWISSVRTTYPTAILIGLTLTDYVGASGTILSRIDTVNAHILSGAGFDYTVDLASDSRLSNPANTTYYDVDGIHRTDAGYAVVAELINAVTSANGLLLGEFYVRKDGSDSNDGFVNTSGGSWLTIQKAANTMASGDITYVQVGRYDEIVTVNTATNTLFVGSSATNRGWSVSKFYTQIRNFECNGTNVSSSDGVLNFNSGSSYSSISNVIIRGYGSSNSGALGVNMASALTNIYLQKLNLQNPNGHAFTLVGRGHTVTNCTIYGTNGWDAFRIVASSVNIVKNTITEWSNPGDWNPNHTDLFQSFGDNFDIATNVVIGENIVLAASGCQLGNVTDDQEDGSISNWTWRNNVFVDVSNTINLYSPDHKFYNNTFIRCGPTSGWAIIHGSSGAGHANNLIIENNIFYQCGVASQANRGWYSGDAVTGMVTNYNLVVGTGAGTIKSGFGEANGINGSDPVFVSSSDFHLQNTSPAIGVGLALNSTFTTDLEGTTRGAAWDLGAYENNGSGGGGGGGGSSGSRITLPVTLRNPTTVR